MSDVQATQGATSEALAVAREFARELAASRGRMLAYFQEKEKLSLAQARVKAGGKGDVDWHERTRHEEADKLSWWALDGLADVDPAGAQLVWERVKSEAQDELESGNRAAKALEHDSTPWERAQFLVVRASFRQEWQPKGGVESALLDTLALSYTASLFWLGQLHVRVSLDSKDVDGKRRDDGYWVPPRVSATEATEEAAVMTDRFNRMFLRTLRALRDLRRDPPTMVIQNASQVNVGSQQVNVSTERPTCPTPSVPCR